MKPIQLLLLFCLVSNSYLFSQQEEKSAHLILNIRNESGEVFKGTIELLANQDTIPVTASWDNSFRVDLLPGNYQLVLKNKLFDDYRIDSVSINPNEVKILHITWKHRTIRLPEIRFHL